MPWPLFNWTSGGVGIYYGGSTSTIDFSKIGNYLATPNYTGVYGTPGTGTNSALHNDVEKAKNDPLSASAAGSMAKDVGNAIEGIGKWILLALALVFLISKWK